MEQDLDMTVRKDQRDEKGRPLIDWVKQVEWLLLNAEVYEEWEDITLAGIARIIMRKEYAIMGESIYPNLSSLSRDFPEASGRLLRNSKEFTFQDMANGLERLCENQFSTLTNAYASCIDR